MTTARFAFVSARRGTHAVASLCRVIGASVSGFYAWLRAIPKVQARTEAEVELRREGQSHSRRRVARLMREMGLSARQDRGRTPRTTNSRHDPPVAPNLLARNFTADRPDQVWLTDVSYIPTDDGWLNLAAVKDIATREPDPERQSKVLGWSMANHLRAE